MINQMDALVEGGRGDEQYMQLFKDMYVILEVRILNKIVKSEC